MIIRMIQEDDADQYLQLQKTIAGETSFMLRDPDEITETVEQLRASIARVLSQEYLAIFVAEHGGQLVGFLRATGSNLRRIKHKVYIVIGILQAFTGQGVGTNLFIEMEQWARQRGMTRLELTVMEHNQAGIALYKKRGFVIEGTQHHAFFIDGRYVDEYLMGKLLT